MTDNTALFESLWEAPSVYREDLFDAQTVLVSGGGSGIGCATALLFARLGAEVVICGRTGSRLDAVAEFAAGKGRVVRPVVCDVRDTDAVDAMFARFGRDFGPLAATVNNAGGQFPQSAIDFSDKGWRTVIDNNLNGTWTMMQRAARCFRDQGTPGSIVNIVVVMQRGLPGVAHTVAARAGIIGAMNTVAVEWAPLGIRVNCIAPGLIATRGLDVYPPEAVAEFPQANPMRRPGTSMEIAEACVYASSPAGSFLTGEVLTVDGGGQLWGEIWTAGRPAHFQPRNGLEAAPD